MTFKTNVTGQIICTEPEFSEVPPFLDTTNSHLSLRPNHIIFFQGVAKYSIECERWTDKRKGL